MITFTKGDIFQSGADMLVNPVNTVGVMGAGLALKFKQRYPVAFKEYVKLCHNDNISPGLVGITRMDNEKGRYIAHFPTKRNFTNPSRMSYIFTGFHSLIEQLRQYKDVRTVAVPALGCGLGELKWESVRAMIESTLHCIGDDNDWIVYEPWE